MTMIEMAYERAEELGLQLRLMTDKDGVMLFTLDYPEDLAGPRAGLAIRITAGIYIEEAAKWLLGQMACDELLEQAEWLSAEASAITVESVVGSASTAATSQESSDVEHLEGLSTAVLEAQLRLSLLLEEVRNGEPSAAELESAIGEIGTALNRPWESKACQDLES